MINFLMMVLFLICSGLASWVYLMKLKLNEFIDEFYQEKKNMYEIIERTQSLLKNYNPKSQDSTEELP